MMSWIKPCPKCNSRYQVAESHIEIYDRTRYKGYRIRCVSCGQTGKMFPTRQEAVDFWNEKMQVVME